MPGSSVCRSSCTEEASAALMSCSVMTRVTTGTSMMSFGVRVAVTTTMLSSRDLAWSVSAVVFCAGRERAERRVSKASRVCFMSGR